MTDHHSSDAEGLGRVHLTQLPQGFRSTSTTHALLILTLSILDQTSANCKDKNLGQQAAYEKMVELSNFYFH